MIHAHNFITYVKREFFECLVSTVLFLATELFVFRMFSYESAAFFNSVNLLLFLLILFYKSVLVRIYYLFLIPVSDYKQTESITTLFIFSIIISLVVMVFGFCAELLLKIYSFSDQYQSMIVYASVFAALTFPVMMTEMIFAATRKSGLIVIFRYSSIVMFSASLIFPLVYNQDLILIQQFFVLSAIIRFIIFMVLLFDFQMLDFFSVTWIRLQKSIKEYIRFILCDISFWLILPVFYSFIFFQIPPEFQVIWCLGFSFFSAIQYGFHNSMGQWNLIFKNFIRLDMTNQYTAFIHHVNLWLTVLFFAAIPFFILITPSFFQWEMNSIPETISMEYLLTAMILISISGYFFSNPVREQLIYFGKIKELNNIIFSSAAGIIISSFFFYYLIGLWGFYFCFMIGAFIYWMGLNILIHPLLGVGLKELFPFRQQLKIIFSSVLAAGFSYSISLVPTIIFHKAGWMMFVYYSTYSLLIIYFGVLKTDSATGFTNWSRRLGNLH